MHVCPQCQSDRLVNNGSVAGKPKKLCKQCSYQFTRTTWGGTPLVMKVPAVLLYLSGISMHRIAFLLRVSAQSVLKWLRTFAQEHYESQSLPAKRSSWSWTRGGPTSSTRDGSFGSGRSWILIPVNSWTGNVVGVTRRP
jgi:transposase-like protein